MGNKPEDNIMLMLAVGLICFGLLLAPFNGCAVSASIRTTNVSPIETPTKEPRPTATNRPAPTARPSGESRVYLPVVRK